MEKKANGYKVVVIGIGVALVVAAVVVAGYLGGWWLKEDAVNRGAEIRRDQFEVQETSRDELVRQSVGIEAIEVDLADPDLTEQQRDALIGQRTAMVRQLCNVASDISGSVTPSVDAIIITYC